VSSAIHVSVYHCVRHKTHKVLDLERGKRGEEAESTYFFNSNLMWCSLAVGNMALIFATVASVSICVGVVKDVS
jgi:hypothetical protein